MKLKKKIKAGIPVLGTWNTSYSQIISSAIACSGVDFQIIDFEHGPCNFEKLHTLVSSAHQHNSELLVRVPALEPWMSQQALDQGADGIVFSSIHCAQDAKKAKDMCLYPPQGTRGFSPYTPSNQFNSIPSNDFTKNANKSKVCVFIVESLEGISNLESILATKPDVVYFGAYDLSKELGIPGQTSHPNLIKIITKASKVVTSSNIMPGSFVPHTIKSINFCIRNKLNFITYSIDTFILTSSLRSAANALIPNK